MIIQGRILLDADVPPQPGWLRVEGDRIIDVHRGDPPAYPDLGDQRALIAPGFVDAHIHPPQIDCIGYDGLPLMAWLDQVIYPAEMRWADPAVARRQVERAYGRMLRAGTLGYAGYLASHPHGVAETIRIAHHLPLRAVVGQMLMDRHAPQELISQPVARLSRSARGRLDTSLNPRFAPACSQRLLAETGRRLAEGFPFTYKEREEGEMGLHLYLQTHLAESQQECETVARLFPDAPHYAAVYDEHGLLGPRTLLAHCVHLSDDEWRLIAERDAVVVHCPTANLFLQSGVFDLDAARRHGVRLALGSDVAAGPDLAMPRIARAMIETAKFRKMTTAPHATIPTPAEAWNLITRGNADALGWHDFGRIEPGASADLLLIRPRFEPDDHMIARLIYRWDDAMIETRIVAGRVI